MRNRKTKKTNIDWKRTEILTSQYLDYMMTWRKEEIILYFGHLQIRVI